MVPLLVLAGALAAPTPATQATDVCLAMIPPRLAAQLSRDQSDYVAPLLTDAPVDRLMQSADNGGWPCPFVAIADVDGDGLLDRAVILKHKSQPVVRLVIARNADAAWRIELQKDWPFAIGAAIVEPLEAGLYQQTKGSPNVAAQLDNLNSVQADHAGFLGGQADGAKQGLFFVDNRWREIWLED